MEHKRLCEINTRVVESDIKCPTPTPTFAKISDSVTQPELSLSVNDFVAASNKWKAWCTARNLYYNKSFKRNSTISIGTNSDSLLRVAIKKMVQLDILDRIKNPTQTLSVFRNPTPP